MTICNIDWQSSTMNILVVSSLVSKCETELLAPYPQKYKREYKSIIKWLKNWHKIIKLNLMFNFSLEFWIIYVCIKSRNKFIVSKVKESNRQRHIIQVAKGQGCGKGSTWNRIQEKKVWNYLYSSTRWPRSPGHNCLDLKLIK